MRFGKRTMFAILQGIMLFILLLHLGRWLFSGVVEGRVTTPYAPTNISVQYTVGDVSYEGTYMRNGFPYAQKTAPIRYLTYNPSKSRLNTFLGIAAEPLAWWLVLTVGMAALLLTDNTVFSKGTTFQLHKRFPWISMDEYFPVKSRWFHRSWYTRPEQESPPTKSTEHEKLQLPNDRCE